VSPRRKGKPRGRQRTQAKRSGKARPAGARRKKKAAPRRRAARARPASSRAKPRSAGSKPRAAGSKPRAAGSKARAAGPKKPPARPQPAASAPAAAAPERPARTARPAPAPSEAAGTPARPDPAAPGTSAARRRARQARRGLLISLGTALAAVALFACYRGPADPEPDPTVEAPVHVDEPRVRVALVERGDAVAVDLTGGWLLEPAHGEPLRVDLAEGDGIAVRPRGGSGLEVSGAVTRAWDATELWIRAAAPASGPAPAFGLGDRRYRGDLHVRLLPDGGLRAINHVGLEDYLAGVLGHEMPLSWSDPALHAQAIAARTYALATRKPGAEYDLFADTRSQVYRGIVAEDAKARRIVDETRGRVVTHDGELVVTYFHSTCGGDTVPAAWIFPWVDEVTEPLSGTTGCRCQASRLYRWTEEVDLTAAWELVLELPLQAVEVVHYPRGGYVKEVVFTEASGGETRVSGWDFRRVFGAGTVKNYAFDLELLEGGRALRVDGRGWGHGVGMCQFGAEGFAKEGLDGEAIVEHFYPGARVESYGY